MRGPEHGVGGAELFHSHLFRAHPRPALPARRDASIIGMRATRSGSELSFMIDSTFAAAAMSLKGLPRTCSTSARPSRPAAIWAFAARNGVGKRAYARWRRLSTTRTGDAGLRAKPCDHAAADRSENEIAEIFDMLLMGSGAWRKTTSPSVSRARPAQSTSALTKKDVDGRDKPGHGRTSQRRKELPCCSENSSYGWVVVGGDVPDPAYSGGRAFRRRAVLLCACSRASSRGRGAGCAPSRSAIAVSLLL